MIITEKNDEIFDLITKMYAEMLEMKGDISGIKGDVSSLKSDVTKNSLLLEKLDSNVRLLAEGQESFRDQIGRSTTEDKRSISDRLDIVELAIKSTSSDVKFIKHKVQETEADVFNIQSHLKIIK